MISIVFLFIAKCKSSGAHLTMSQKGSISPGQLGKPKTPWCCAPKVIRFLIWGWGHRWATARRNWPPCTLGHNSAPRY